MNHQEKNHFKVNLTLNLKAIPEPMEAEEVMRMKRVVETKETTLLQRDVHEQSPPEFQRLFQDKAVNAGEPVTFECSITGSPKPKVTLLITT